MQLLIIYLSFFVVSRRGKLGAYALSTLPRPPPERLTAMVPERTTSITLRCCDASRHLSIRARLPLTCNTKCLDEMSITDPSKNGGETHDFFAVMRLYGIVLDDGYLALERLFLLAVKLDLEHVD